MFQMLLEIAPWTPGNRQAAAEISFGNILAFSGGVINMAYGADRALSG